MRHKLLPTIAIMTLVISALSLGVYTYWNFQPTNVITVNNQPVPVRPKVINPEATVILTPNICKNMQRRAIVHRTLLSNTTKILLPDYYNDLPVGCSTHDIAVIIPELTPDGTYRLVFDVEYEINPIKRTSIRWYSQDFVIRNEPPISEKLKIKNITPVSDSIGKAEQTTTVNGRAVQGTASSQVPQQRDILKELFDGVGQTVQDVISGANKLLNR